MCDRLEWCRTYAAENYHLHHFQQRDLFKSAVGTVPNPALDILVQQGVPYEFQVAAKTLVFLMRLLPLGFELTKYESELLA